MQKISTGILGKVEEGMEVYDSAGERVGTVNFLRMGEEDPTNLGVESTRGEPNNPPQTALMQEIAKVLGPMDNVPDQIKERMWRYGYIRIGTGLLHSDRVALHTQLADVDANEERITLSVNQDALYKL